VLKNKKKGMYAILASVTALALALGGCSSQEAGSDKQEEKPSASPAEAAADLKGEYVTILTGGSSGVYFPLGGTLAKIYQEKLGATATSQSTAASAENAKKLNQQKAELGFLMGDTAADAYEGVDSFKESGAQENLRSVAALYPNYLQIVTIEGTGVETIEDLKGKKLAVGAPGSGTEISANRLLKAYGMTYDDLKVDFLSFAEGVEGIKNGTVDAVVISSGLPNSGVLELATTKEVKVLEISEEIIGQLAKDYPAFYSAPIPKETYEGMAEDVTTIAVNNVLMTHKDVPEETVYLLTKFMYENLKQLQDTHNAAKDISIDKAQTGLPAPLHPGAEKYFTEAIK
jgi:TRAP transporter TAXI family solute receptor